MSKNILKVSLIRSLIKIKHHKCDIINMILDYKCDSMAMQELFDNVIKNKKENIFQILLKMRQVCCNLSLLKQSERNATDQLSEEFNNVLSKFPFNGFQKSSKVTSYITHLRGTLLVT